jgi:moderate conductance mechanosensitive channel
VLSLLAQSDAPPGDLCLRGEGPDASADPFCELLFRATSNETLAQFAGLIGTVVRIAVILVVAFMVTRLARRLVARFAATMESRIAARVVRDEAKGTLDRERYKSRRYQRLQAITGVARGIVGFFVWVIALLMVISTLGISLQPVLAGAGLLSVVIGFGAQQLVRDVLAGIAMLIEDQFGVGDLIDVHGRVGIVERVGLRATAVRDIDGVQWHVLNGSFDQVGNLSQEYGRSALDVPVALDADVPTAKAIIYKVASELAQDAVWGQDIIGEPEIWGVQSYGPEGLSIRVVMPTKPMANWDINRQMRERLHHAFTTARIRMPSQLVDLGGQSMSYPVLSREDAPSPADPALRTDPQRRRGVVPQELRQADEPIDVAEVTGDAYEDRRDRTTELRLERGREPRPD